jgi:sec-independent protein translocase protein TatB
MFDIGFSELLLIAVVALLVLGPERLPEAARFTGLWVRKARAQWYSVKSEFEREMAADELKRSIGDPAQDLRREVESAGRELKNAVHEVEADVRADADAATTVQNLPPAPAQDAPPATSEPDPFAVDETPSGTPQPDPFAVDEVPSATPQPDLFGVDAEPSPDASERPGPGAP